LLQRWIEKLSYFLGSVGAGVIFALMLITGIDVVGRYLFQSPLSGAFELSELALALMVIFGWGYNQAVKGHVEIDLLYKRLPQGVQTILDCLIPLLGLSLFVFVSWQAINFTITSIGWGENTEMLHLPVWIFKLMIFVGAVAISLQFVVDFVAACQKVKGKA
jgi:TRAP-type C4-dicarboxylate transport system permease small subunit